MAGFSDLDFHLGLEIEKLVANCFQCTVSPSFIPLGFKFSPIASFGRSSVRLNDDSVSLLLQSSLCGTVKDFRAIHLSGWMFHFSVSCKKVGLLIYKLKSFSCKGFVVFFLVWGNGGPNWLRDFDCWTRECEAEWTLVGAKGKKSFADVVKFSLSVFKRLSFHKDY